MQVELNCLTTWKPCLDHAPWSFPIWFLFAKTCSCPKVSSWPRNCQRNSSHCICFQENFCRNKDIMIGVLEPLSQSWDKQVNSKETQTMKRCTKIHCWWEPWEISTFQRLSQTTNQFSWDSFKTCSPTLSQRTRNPQIWPKFVKRQQRMTWVSLLRKVSLKNVSIYKTFLTSDIVVSLLVRQVAVRQLFGKHCCNHWRESVKMVKLILSIPKPLTSTSCSVITLNLKNGETVCCQSSWKIKISVKKNTKRLTSISGQSWMVMLILCGSNHWIPSWTTIRCSHLSQTTEFHLHPQWDFCSKFQTWRTPVQLQSQEEVCFSSTSLISGGDHSLTVG